MGVKAFGLKAECFFLYITAYFIYKVILKNYFILIKTKINYFFRILRLFNVYLTFDF